MIPDQEQPIQTDREPGRKESRIVIVAGVALLLACLGYFLIVAPPAEIVFVGDTAIGIGPGEAYVAQNGLKAPFEKIQRAFRKNDFLIAGLRGAMAFSQEKGQKPLPGMLPESAAKAMADLGIDGLGLANPEVMAFGVDGFEQTLKALDAAGIHAFGGGRDGGGANRPWVIRQKGVRIGILPFYQGAADKDAPIAGPGKPGIVNLSSKSLPLEIRRLAKKVHVVIVNAHWARSYGAVDKKQRELADLFIRSGADLVVGQGTSAAQRFEMLRNAPVIYSLGNFVHHGARSAGNARPVPAGSSLIARVRLTTQGVKDIELTALSHADNKETLQPKLAEPGKASALFGKIIRVRKAFRHFYKNKAVLNVAALRAQSAPPKDVAGAFFQQLYLFLPVMLLAVVSALLIGMIGRLVSPRIGPRLKRWIPRALLAVSLAGGLLSAWQKKSLIDDSFITFRYIRNFLDGNGLVFNIGERVEGYTNFLWALLVAFFSWITHIDIPYIGFFGCLVFFVANLVTIWVLGRKISCDGPDQTYVPIAVVWLALQHSFHSFATTGMETMFGSWLVNLSVLFLLSPRRKSGAGLAGLFLILATLTRPDHAIFYVCMAAAVALRIVRDLWDARRQKARWIAAAKSGLAEVLAYSLPFAGYLGYLLWKWFYYGSIVPNTYFAKSANLSYWAQGWNYTLITGLSMHLTVILPLFLIWLVLMKGSKPFHIFAGLSTFGYMLYVAKIGGDFMMGRFYISILPLMLLGVEDLIHRVGRSAQRKPAWIAIALAALVAGTVCGLPIIPPGKSIRHITDESTYYTVSKIFPLTIVKQQSKKEWPTQGKLFKSAFKDKGFSPVMATGGIGMFGYYSELPILDKRGLVDVYVAHRPLEGRGKPGHEKRATSTYMDARDVLFITFPSKTRDFRNFSIKGDPLFPWRLRRYDADLMDRLAEVSPEFNFVRFPEYLDQHFNDWKKQAGLAAAKTLVEYDHFYFTRNQDPERRQRYLDRFARWWDFEQGMPEKAEAEGVFTRSLVSPAREGLYSIEGFQGAVTIATTEAEQGTLRFPSFPIAGDTLGFYIGGANNPKQVAAVLSVEGKEVGRWSGRGDDQLRLVSFKTSPYRGMNASLVLIDHSETGRLLFDMVFEAVDKIE